MRRELEDILLEVSKSPIIDSGDLDASQEQILQATIQGLQVMRCSIWMLSNDGEAISCRQLIDKRESEPQAGMILTRQQFPDYFQALLSERNIIASDIHNNSSTQEFSEIYAQPLGIDAMLDTPLRHKGKMIGVLCSEHCGGKRPWQVDEITFAGAMADIFGRAVSAAERSNYERKLHLQNERLEEMVAERTASLKEALSNFEQAQQRLLETEKMAALGKLVAGVAHEVNTPLGIAVTAITHCDHRLGKLKQSYTDGKLSRQAMQAYIDDTQQAYQLLSSNLDRAALLIQNFKKTAVDQSSYELVDCKIKQYIAAVMFSLRPLLKKANAEFDLDCDESLSVRTYQGAIAQILTNMVGNACEHAFTDETSGTKRDRLIRISVEPSENGVLLRFKDNGKGMDAQTRKHIFDPFYTTARHSGGSGLGLSIVYNLLTQKLAGDIAVKTAPGAGAEFELYIPNMP